MKTKIWNYGARPRGDTTYLHEQLFLAHRYYNTLIELERSRRDEYRKAREALADVPELNARYDALTVEIELRRKEVKATNQKNRKREPNAEAQCLIRSLKQQRSEVAKERTAARELLKTDEGLKKRSEEIDAEFTVAQKQARANCGVYWGTYLLYEKAFDAARKSKTDPKFRRWSGTGRVGVQLQGGLLKSEVLSEEDTRLRIAPLPADSWDTRSKRRQAYSEVSVRIGSTETGKPIWAPFSVEMHRKLPPGCTIKWAWVKVAKIGNHTRYWLQLTLQSTDFPEHPRGNGVAGVDIGWRVMPNGDIRVGYLVDDEEQKRSFEIPRKIREGFKFVERLRSAADKCRNEAMPHFEAWVKENRTELPEWMAEATKYMHKWRTPARLAKVVGRWSREVIEEERLDELVMHWKGYRLGREKVLFEAWVKENRTELPEWMAEATKYMHQWRPPEWSTPARLAKVVGRWSREGVAPEQLEEVVRSWKAYRLARAREIDLFASREETEQWFSSLGITDTKEHLAIYLELWRRKNAHLHNWESGERRKLINRRNNLYRCWAVELTTRYGTIVLEDFDLRSMAQKAAPEDEEQQTTLMRYIRAVGAPSEFRMAIERAMGKEHAVKRDPAWTTQDCSLCGAENELEDTTKLLLPPCPGCGEVIDQDENAGRNLLKRFCESQGDGKKAAASRRRGKRAA